MSQERDRNIAITGLAFLGIGGLLYLGAGNAVNNEASARQSSGDDHSPTTIHQGEWPPTPTPIQVQGQLVHPQPEGVTLPQEVGKDGEPLLEVVSKWGDVYKVQRISTGQYKIIYPEPKLLDIKFLRESDIQTIK